MTPINIQLKVRRDRVSERFSPRASRSRSKAKPTTTWARASRAAGSSFMPRAVRASLRKKTSSSAMLLSTERPVAKRSSTASPAERFAVRNSGSTAVVEGVGDHGCEYMTNGLVSVLGSCGRNFAAGMSGGLAYVFDERGDFTEERCNLESVDLEPLLDGQDLQVVKGLVTRHVDLTGSRRAKWILDNWSDAVSRFIKVFPHEFKRVLGVGRSEQAYIPSEHVAVLANAEQVQHG